MSNMLEVIVPKSDQQNYDDMIGGVTKTIKVTKVTIKAGDQPTSIFFEGDGGKPYKPCKSMARVLVHCWGADANNYVGRSMTLYGDPTVVFGAAKVGGIRISHLSDIKEPITMALTSSKANRKPFTVKPLTVAPDPVASPALIAAVEDAASLGTVRLEAHWKALSKPDQLLLKPHMEKMKEIAAKAEVTE